MSQRSRDVSPALVQRSTRPTALLRSIGWLTSLAGCAGLVDRGESDSARNVGAPCVVGDEAYPTFSGFSEREVNIEDGGSCGLHAVCLVHKFRGRATCPEGQKDARAGTCQTSTGEPVTVAVTPQLPDRPAELAMICSCRCDGPDSAADYCACPDGMRCESLVYGPVVESGAQPAADHVGSYCVY
jgi:hypothetical protein